MTTTRILIGSALITLGAALPAGAQTLQTSGSADLGARTTSLTGDGARYERYRDLSNGLFLDAARLQAERKNWIFDFGVDHAARKDARYEAGAIRPGLFKSWFRWDQIPMLMSRTTQTLYTTASPGVLRLSDTLQQTMQSTAAAGQTAVLTNFVNTQATVFTLDNRRHIAAGGVKLMPDADTTVTVDVQRTNREGVIPFGATFGLSNTTEVPLPVSHRLTDVSASVERSQGRFLFRAGYTGSWFTNENASLVWDNPYRLTDSATVSSQGRMPLAPSNSSVGVNGAVSVSLPSRTRVTAFVSFGTLDDRGTALIPQTINTALAVVPLSRTTVGGHAQTRAVNLTMTSRPAKPVTVAVRYRYYNYENETPLYSNSQRANYDSSVSTLATPSVTERYGGARQALDADVTFRSHGSTFGAGYTRRAATYEERIFKGSSENTARLFYDAFRSQWFSLHSKYEHAIRRGRSLDTAELVAIGEQPGMRTFDIADRDRDLFTLTGSFTPLPTLAFNVSAGAGRDKYPNSQFGLYRAKHGVYSVGIDAVPTENVTFGASYDIEDYRTLQWSRQANPGVQQTDPSRDWSTDGHDTVHSVLANLQIAKIAERVDLRIGYDFNRGRTLYLYGTGAVADRTLPEGSTVIPSTLPTPTQLPPVFSQLNRGTLDLTCAVTARVAVGFSYWYEKYEVDDFALDAEAIPRINLPNALLLGYQYLPYTAHTFWGRLIVRW